jgi:hypothetical protein
MRTRKQWAGLALVAMGALFASGCGDTIIGGDTTNVTVGGPSGLASPSPGPGAGGLISTVKVTQFGETCPNGTSSSGEARSVRVGCEKHLTCTPFLADGSPAPVAVHGPTPDFFGLVAGGSYVVVTVPGESFNRDARGTAPGVASFACTAKGIRSEQFDLTVVP